MSGGRFVLGIGAGAASFDAEVLGSPTLTARQRFDRFAEFVELLDEVLTADVTTWRGEYYQAVDARSLPGCVQQPRMPFVIAANGPRGLKLAARLGEGWVTTGTTRDSDEAWWASVGVLARRFDETLAAAGRPAGDVRRYLQVDASPTFALSSVDCFRDVLGRAAELGFTDVITHWPRRDSWYAGDESVLETVATDILGG